MDTVLFGTAGTRIRREKHLRGGKSDRFSAFLLLFLSQSVVLVPPVAPLVRTAR